MQVNLTHEELRQLVLDNVDLRLPIGVDKGITRNVVFFEDMKGDIRASVIFKYESRPR